MSPMGAEVDWSPPRPYWSPGYLAFDVSFEGGGEKSSETVDGFVGGSVAPGAGTAGLVGSGNGVSSGSAVEVS